MDINSIKETIIECEGVTLKPRKYDGELIIGVGHRIERDGISYKMAMQMLEEDIRYYDQNLGVFIGPEYEKIPPIVKEALIHMCFCIGYRNVIVLNQFMECIRKGKYAEAARCLANNDRYLSKYGARWRKIVIEILMQEEDDDALKKASTALTEDKII